MVWRGKGIDSKEYKVSAGGRSFSLFLMIFGLREKGEKTEGEASSRKMKFREGVEWGRDRLEEKRVAAV